MHLPVVRNSARISGIMNFTDSKENLDLGDVFFRNEPEAGGSSVGDRGKKVASDDFSNEEEKIDQLLIKGKISELNAPSSQPFPPKVASNSTPSTAWPGRSRRATTANCASQQPPTQPQRNSSNGPNTNSSTKPVRKSASQPNKKTTIAASKPTSKPSSSQPIAQRLRFCVRHVGGPHVSPQKLRKMAKLRPRDSGSI
ncbi:hypothetical protein PIB30_080753 [Stylosanthes scabra]|uniref:Uncharacterized protein n=1 Tax=Stylosanthes scabra TaxID=79078 RepID=A0ABU6VSJ3_9FABA|nr:hypothetical protein [Stylosanthes scabra]